MKIGRIALTDPAIPAAKQEAVAREVERAITSIFTEPSEFVAAEIPTGHRDDLRAALIRFCDREKCHLVLTTGGTGPGPNDFAPDVTLEIVDRHLPGLGELMRHSSFEHYKVAVLSRAEGGVRGRSLIINLPSRPAPVKFCLRVLQEGIVEAIEQLNGIQVGLRGDEVVIPLEKYLPFLKHIRPKSDPSGPQHPLIR
jgi:molybdopterin adenylyltransferase